MANTIEKESDRPSDVGIVLRAPGPVQLYEDMARTMFNLLTDVNDVEAKEERQIRVRGEGREDLLVKWLAELLSLHASENLLLGSFRIESLEKDHLKAVASGERYDASRHALRRTLSGVSQRRALVSEESGVWSARVILDA